MLSKGSTSEAISHYKESIKIKPDYADAHDNLTRIAMSLAREIINGL